MINMYQGFYSYMFKNCNKRIFILLLYIIKPIIIYGNVVSNFEDRPSPQT